MKYICKSCLWEGSESELEFDDVETCMGNSKVEMCPKCGSFDVWISQPQRKNRRAYLSKFCKEKAPSEIDRALRYKCDS